MDFWFGHDRKAWFGKDPLFDAEIDRLFRADVERAVAGDLDDWLAEPESCLALLVLLDQFPRNLYRNDPRAWAADPKALAAARHALAQGFDELLPERARPFIYMPFMHSENVDDQRRCVGLFERLGDEDALRSARRHRDIIDRFGRFPHRNAVLARESTSVEAKFLLEPNSSF